MSSNPAGKNALLLANGAISEAEYQLIKHQSFDMIVAADGGAHHALRWQLQPDAIVGDFDSITPIIRERLPDANYVHRPSQDINDLEKALQFCQEQGVSEITLLGACGRRLDHTISNLSVVSRYDQIFRLNIFDAYAQIFIVRDQWRYEGLRDQLVSLIPVGRVAGVRTQGLGYPLDNEPLEFGTREGLSNYIVSNPVTISIASGVLLVFVVLK